MGNLHGKYRAKAVGGEFGVSTKKGTDFVQVGFVIVGGEDDGRRIDWSGYFTENTTERTIESLRYCGCTFPGNDITNLDGLDRNEVEIVVEENDKGYPEVRWVNSGAGRGVGAAAMSPAKKTDFRARMKAALVSSGASSGAGASSRTDRVRDTVRDAFADEPPPFADEPPF